MATSGSAKGILVLVALVILALGLAGFITGAIGAAFLDQEGLLPTPGVHLAPQEILGENAGHELTEGGFDFVITNTILSSLVTSLVLILLFVVGTSRMSLAPGRLQGLLEAIVEAMLNFVESVMGAGKGRGIFPLAATIFLFVAFNSWLALIPIYQTFGVLKENDAGQTYIYATLLRPAGTDLNMPMALALISFVVVEALGFRAHGFGYLGEFIRFGQLLRGRILTGLIDLFVGVLEAVSHLVRVVSFTFRLFGNMTAGEILLLVTSFLITFIFSVPFYGLELMVGLIQGVIFAALTVVFAAIAVAPHEGEAEH